MIASYLALFSILVLQATARPTAAPQQAPPAVTPSSFSTIFQGAPQVNTDPRKPGCEHIGPGLVYLKVIGGATMRALDKSWEGDGTVELFGNNSDKKEERFMVYKSKMTQKLGVPIATVSTQDIILAICDSADVSALSRGSEKGNLMVVLPSFLTLKMLTRRGTS